MGHLFRRAPEDSIFFTVSMKSASVSERISNGRGGTDLSLIFFHTQPQQWRISTMLLITIMLIGCSLLAVPSSAAAERLTSPRVTKVKELALRQHQATRSASVADVGECILLFGPFCNGESRGVSRVSMSTNVTYCMYNIFRSRLPRFRSCIFAVHAGNARDVYCLPLRVHSLVIRA